MQKRLYNYFMPTSGEIAAISAIVGAAISFLGITGIDANLISSAVNGLVAFVTILATVFAYYKHRQAVKTTTTQ